MVDEIFGKAHVIDRLNILLNNIEEIEKKPKKYNVQVSKAITKGLIRDIGKRGVIVRPIKYEEQRITYQQKRVLKKGTKNEEGNKQ